MKRSTKKRIEKKMEFWVYLIYSKVFKNYLETGIFDLDEICQGIEKCTDVLRCWCREVKRVHAYLHSKGYEFPDPYKTYGYESLEQIERELRYMCDRFVDPKKMIWLLYLPAEVDRLKKNAI